MVFRRLIDFCLVILLCGAPVLATSGCQHGHTKIVKTYTLAPKQKKRISFKADHETTVSFNSNLSALEQAKVERGFRVTNVNRLGEGEVLTGKTNMHVNAVPDEGEITLLLENLEKRTIKLYVSWRGD